MHDFQGPAAEDDKLKYVCRHGVNVSVWLGLYSLLRFPNTIAGGYPPTDNPTSGSARFWGWVKVDRTKSKQDLCSSANGSFM